MTTGERPRRSLRARAGEVGGKWALLLASVCLTLVMAELVVRASEDAWTTENRVVARRARWRAIPPVEFHARLGWVPRAHQQRVAKRWGGVLVTTVEEGLRSNGPDQPPTSDRPLIVAVGDSFTFGDEVADGDTWPANLERRLGVRVQNGGVAGYGFDQTVLRGIELAVRHRPELLIASFIDDDVGSRVARCMRDGAYKPCFSLVDGELVDRANPVPPPDSDLDPLRRWLGYSVLVDLVASRAWPELWLLGARAPVTDEPYDVSCRLLGRLVQETGELGTSVLLVAQAGLRDLEPKAYPAMATCAQAEGVPYLDLHAPLRELGRRHAELLRSFFFDHMSPAGNAWVAERIAAFVRERGLLSSGALR